PGEAIGAVRRTTRAFRLDPERSVPFLLGGADVAFECTGGRSGLELALRSTKARGKVVLSGMPPGADLTPAWYRELEVVGSYSGSGSFEDSVALAADGELGKLVSDTYPLAAWREALDHALGAGSSGAVKIAFDPRLDD
ncbi:MAG: zinc-binding dehydrogenase, partial [Acidimicrobiia bacterium]